MASVRGVAPIRIESHAPQIAKWRERRKRIITMPDTETLTEELLQQIEAHFEISNDSMFARSYIPALCRSLRAAWADVARLSELADKRHDELCETRRQRDSLAADMNTYIRDATATLREQLATQAESIIEFQAQLKEAHANVESLSQIIFRSEHATAMRDACIEKVKAMRNDWQIQADARRDPDAPHDYKGSYGLASGAVDACDDIIEALESLTLP